MPDNGAHPPVMSPPAVTPPMGDRRPMYGPPGAQLGLDAPAPQMHYPQIPPPIQPSAPAPQYQQQPQQQQPSLYDEVFPQHQAMILDGLRQKATIQVIQQHFPFSANAIWKLAAQYQQPVWDGAQWLQPPAAAPAFPGAQQQLPPMPQQPPPVQSIAAKPAAPPTDKKTKRRLGKDDYAPIAKLRAAGKDSSTIAMELGMSPDAVMRAFKKLDAAAGDQAPAQQQIMNAPALQANASAAARALELQVGQIIPGVQSTPPLEREMIRARGLELRWIEAGKYTTGEDHPAGWQVVANAPGTTKTNTIFWCLGTAWGEYDTVVTPPTPEMLAAAEKHQCRWVQIGAENWRLERMVYAGPNDHLTPDRRHGLVPSSQAGNAHDGGYLPSGFTADEFAQRQAEAEHLRKIQNADAAIVRNAHDGLLVDVNAQGKVVPAEASLPTTPPPADYANQIGVWLNDALSRINEKLEKHGLRAELSIQIR